MNNKNFKRLIFTVFMIAILPGCMAQKMDNKNTPTVGTAIPEITSTPMVTVTNTPEFYTNEERQADGKIWTVEDYQWSAKDMGGAFSGCVPTAMENNEFFLLPKPGDNLVFDNEVFSRLSPNNWAREWQEEQFGEKYLRTLEISNESLIDTMTVTAADNTTTVCINEYTYQNVLPTSTPASDFVPVARTLTTPIFYSDEELAAENKTWISVYPHIIRMQNDGSSGECIYAAQYSDQFTTTMIFGLPNPGEDLLIGQAHFSRISENLWEQKGITQIPGSEYSVTLEFTGNSIVQTLQFVSTKKESVSCINTFFLSD